MKKLILMGRSESGKTTLKQALLREKIQYCKTQYIHYDDLLIDTPGEYAQTHRLGYALALYAYEVDFWWQPRKAIPCFPPISPAW